MVSLLVLFIIGLAISLIMLICHKFDGLTVVMAWIKSTTEEKVGLTKLVGHFNANGYLVHSDSDINIGHNGSFKRFETYDKDIKMATTSLENGDWIPDTIPPQPLRPAPVPIISKEEHFYIEHTFPPPVSTQTSNLSKDSVETSIMPLPRPVSSVNMAALQQSNSQFIQPPPCSNNNNNKVGAASATQQVAENGHAEYAEVVSGVLKRAVSCESVCSDTSVVLGDLEESNITGYLCIALEYDSENAEMIANVLEAKELVNPQYPSNEGMDTYVKIFLLPDKNVNVQTKIYRQSHSPSYQERVIFSMHPRDQMNTALLFHIYATDMNSHTLIGEGELSLADVSLRQPVTTWVTLTDTGQNGTEFGELMFSLSYLPTAERLTVVVVKARNLKFLSDKEPGEPFVKAYLLQYGKKMHKKKTSSKKPERSPIFNESMMFNVPAHLLQTIQLRLTVAETVADSPRTYSIGHVIIGAQATGRSLAHWNQMLQALRRPVAMWHSLRK